MPEVAGLHRKLITVITIPADSPSSNPLTLRSLLLRANNSQHKHRIIIRHRIIIQGGSIQRVKNLSHSTTIRTVSHRHKRMPIRDSRTMNNPLLSIQPATLPKIPLRNLSQRLSSPLNIARTETVNLQRLISGLHRDSAPRLLSLPHQRLMLRLHVLSRIRIIKITMQITINFIQHFRSVTSNNRIAFLSQFASRHRIINTQQKPSHS